MPRSVDPDLGATCSDGRNGVAAMGRAIVFAQLLGHHCDVDHRRHVLLCFHSCSDTIGC